MESHVAFHFLEHLVVGPFKHGHRAEAFQISKRAFAVVGSPAPFWIHRPERDVGKHDNRGFRAKTFDVVFEPFQLLVAELPEASGLKVYDVDQPNEVDTIFVKAIPAGALALDAL